MVRIGGFLKTQNRIRRQRARGRFISPYQVGGTIFGKSTMARYPLMHTSSRLLEPSRLLEADPFETTPPPKDERGHDFWHVHPHANGRFHEGPLGSPRKGHDGTLAEETYERGHDFWQVHTHANAPSVYGPVCVPGGPRTMGEDYGPTPTRYKKDTPLNVVDSQHHVAQFV